MRTLYGQAVDSFNFNVQQLGPSPQVLAAEIGNGFIGTLSRIYTFSSVLIVAIVVWVAYAFYAVPVVCSLAKLHVLAGGKW